MPPRTQTSETIQEHWALEKTAAQQRERGGGVTHGLIVNKPPTWKQQNKFVPRESFAQIVQVKTNELAQTLLHNMFPLFLTKVENLALLKERL